MDVSPLGGVAAAQMMFAATAQAAAATGTPDGASSGPASASPAADGVGIAVLRMALDNERRLIDVFA